MVLKQSLYLFEIDKYKQMKKTVNSYYLNNLPTPERIKRCKEILKKEKDESLRWDAVWIVGETAEVEGKNSLLFDKAADLLAWVLQNDDNGVVKHEACYQIAMRKMVKKIPDLLNAALNDKSDLVKHEAIESLGLLNAFDSEEIISKSLNDANIDLRQTVEFVIKRQGRLKKSTVNKG